MGTAKGQARRSILRLVQRHPPPVMFERVDPMIVTRPAAGSAGTRSNTGVCSGKGDVANGLVLFAYVRTQVLSPRSTEFCPLEPLENRG